MKNEITKTELFEENGWNFTTFKSGHLTSEETEHLVPAGVAEEEDNDVQTNSSFEPLYPTGINPK